MLYRNRHETQIILVQKYKLIEKIFEDKNINIKFGILNLCICKIKISLYV